MDHESVECEFNNCAFTPKRSCGWAWFDIFWCYRRIFYRKLSRKSRLIRLRSTARRRCFLATTNPNRGKPRPLWQANKRSCWCEMRKEAESKTCWKSPEPSKRRGSFLSRRLRAEDLSLSRSHAHHGRTARERSCSWETQYLCFGIRNVLDSLILCENLTVSHFPPKSNGVL